MNLFASTSCKGTSCLLLASCVLLGSSAVAAPPQDRQIINEPGGIGVDQGFPEITATSHGALILFSDGRSGAYDYRLRAIDAYGNLTPTSVNIEKLAEPDGGFSSPVLASNPNAGLTILAWRDTGSVYKAATIDEATGNLTSTPAIVERFHHVFVSDSGDVLFTRSIDDRVEGRFYDSNFNALGSAMTLADTSKDELPRFIHLFDAAFAPDGSFVVSWIGATAPYFDQARSQKFNANGSPAGPLQVHTNGDHNVGLWSNALALPDGTCLVTWPYVDGYMGQKLDANGLLSGDAVLLYPMSSDLEYAVDLDITSDGSCLALAENGLATFDPTTLELIHLQTWTNAYHVTETAWLGAAETVLTAWRQVDESDGDYDVLGNRQPYQGSGTETIHLSDDVDGAHQEHSSSDVSSDGRSIIAWEDTRFSRHGNIAFQAFHANGEKDGVNRFIDTPGRRVYSPQVAMNASGEFLISWIDDDPNITRPIRSLMVQRFDANHQESGNPITVYTELDGLTTPIFGGVGSTNSNKRELLLLENGNFFATWGLDVVTGGTIGQPHYGRMDLFTKAYTATNNFFWASTNQKVAGPVHGLIPSGPESAEVLYYNTDTESLQLLEFWATGSSSSEQAFPALPDFGVTFNMNRHMDMAHDGGEITLAWADLAADGSNRAYMARYAADGQIIASEVLENESTFACMQSAPDGSRYILHGTGSELYCKQYDSQDTPLSDSFVVSEDEDYKISFYGVPEFDLDVVNEQIRLNRTIDSGTDQAEEIELSTYDIDPTHCAPADFDCDGFVNGPDLAYLLGHWGLEQADLTGDGTTNGADLTYLLGAWTN